MISTQPDDRGRGIGEMWVLLDVKLSPQSKPPRGKLAERGVDDPSGRCNTPESGSTQPVSRVEKEGSLKSLYLAN